MNGLHLKKDSLQNFEELEHEFPRNSFKNNNEPKMPVNQKCRWIENNIEQKIGVNQKYPWTENNSEPKIRVKENFGWNKNTGEPKK